MPRSIAATAAASAPGDAARAATGVMSLVVVLGMSPWFSPAPVLDQLVAATGLDDSGGPVLTVAVPLGFVAGAVASAVGSLADRCAPNQLLAAGAAAAAATNLAPVLAPGPTIAIASRFAVGCALALVLPVALKVTASWHRTNRGEAIGAVLAGLCIATAAPHVVATADLGWRTALLATSLLGFVGAAVAGLAVRTGPHGFATPSFDPTHALRPFRSPQVRRAYVGYFGHMWELYAAWAWIGSLLADKVEGAAAAVLAAAVISAGAAGCVSGGRAGDRLGHARSARRSLARSGACATLLALCHPGPPAVTVALAAAWGYWVIADSPMFATLVTAHVDRDVVGTALTVQLAIGFSLTTLTLWLVPALRDAVGWSWALLALVPGPILGWAAMAPLERHDEGMHQ